MKELVHYYGIREEVIEKHEKLQCLQPILVKILVSDFDSSNFWRQEPEMK